MISAVFSENCRILVVGKCSAISEHCFPMGMDGQMRSQKTINSIRDQTIKAGGFKQRRKVKTFSKEKTDGGRLGISRDTSCPVKSSTAFAAAGDIKKLKRKKQSSRRRCLQANRHCRPVHAIALLFTVIRGCKSSNEHSEIYLYQVR